MVYKCSICGYIYDEEKEGRPFSDLTECPLCKQPVDKFEVVKGSLPEQGRLFLRKVMLGFDGSGADLGH